MIRELFKAAKAIREQQRRIDRYEKFVESPLTYAVLKDIATFVSNNGSPISISVVLKSGERIVVEKEKQAEMPSKFRSGLTLESEGLNGELSKIAAAMAKEQQ